MTTAATNRVDLQADSTGEDAGSARTEVTKQRRLQQTILASFLVAIAANLPLLLMYFKALWDRPHYKFFPFVFLAIGWFLYKRWPRDGNLFRTSSLSNLLFCTGVLASVLATLTANSWLAMIAAMMLFAGLLARIRDPQTDGCLLIIALPLLAIIRPPLADGTWLITRLQSISALSTSALLDMLGYRHYLSGTVLNFADRMYGVEEACSGVKSFYTLLFCTTVFIVWTRRPIVRAAILLLASGFWGIVMNTIRITAIPVADQTLDIDMASGASHEILGYTTLTLAVLALISTDNLLYFLLGPISSDATNEGSSKWSIIKLWNSFVGGFGQNEAAKTAARYRAEQSALPVPVAAKFGRLEAVVMMAAAAILGVLAILQVYDVGQSVKVAHEKQVSVFGKDITVPMSKECLPAEFAGLKLRNYNQEKRFESSDLGRHSDIWQYEMAEGVALVSLDQPFFGWHELSNCYRSRGWKQVSRKRVATGKKGVELEWPYVETEFVNSTGEHAFLLFSLFDINGDPYDPPILESAVKSFLRRLHRSMTDRSKSRLLGGDTYQSQIFVQSVQELDLETKQAVRERYFEIREKLRSQF